MIQTIRRECLDHFIVFGTRHLDFLISEFCDYYNNSRAHCARDYLPPNRTEPPAENNAADTKTIVNRERLGGLITTFERVAA